MKLQATSMAAKMPKTLMLVIGDRAVTTKAANVVREVTAMALTARRSAQDIF